MDEPDPVQFVHMVDRGQRSYFAENKKKARRKLAIALQEGYSSIYDKWQRHREFRSSLINATRPATDESVLLDDQMANIPVHVEKVQYINRLQRWCGGVRIRQIGEGGDMTDFRGKGKGGAFRQYRINENTPQVFGAGYQPRQAPGNPCQTQHNLAQQKKIILQAKCLAAHHQEPSQINPDLRTIHKFTILDNSANTLATVASDSKVAQRM